MKYIDMTLIGTPGTRLMTHNERLASKLDPIAREMAAVSGKRRKTDDDLAELARLEFIGGVYETEDGLVGIPTWNVFRSLQDGARINKLGRHVERSLVPITDVVEIRHDGPSKPFAAWEAGCFDQRSVKVGQSKVTRTRPAFANWSIDVRFALDTEILNLDDLRLVAANAGRLVGLGDYRPRFGRYDIDILEAKEAV